MVKKLVMIGLAGFFGIELFLLGGEMWARQKFGTVCSQPHPIWHHQLIPSRRCIKKMPEFSVDYKINTLGLRDDEVELKQKGVARILMLGDSFTEGAGVEQEEIFSTLLEKDLGVEVINAGVSADSPILEYLWLKNEGLNLKPDLVIINVNESDFSEEQKYHSAKVIDEAGEIIAVPAKPLIYLPKSIAEWLQRQSTFYGWVNTHVVSPVLRAKASWGKTGVNNKTGGGIFALSKGINKVEYERLWGLMEQDLRRLDKILDGQNIPHLLVLQPFGHHVFGEAWPGRTKHNLEMGRIYNPEYWEAVKKLGGKLDVKVLDLRQAFLTRGDETMFYADDGHWTASGHKLVAKTLGNYLLQSDLLP